MKWKQKKDELGLTDANMTVTVKKKIADYNDIEDSLKSKRAELKAAKTEDEKEIIQGHLDTLQNGLLHLDTTLTKDMERIFKNKDSYAKNAEILKNSKKNKKSVTDPVVEPPKKTAVASAPVADPPKQTTAPVQDPPKQTSITDPPKQTAAPKVTVPPPAKKAKEEDNTLAIVGGVLLVGVLAFFGIRYMRNRAA